MSDDAGRPQQTRLRIGFHSVAILDGLGQGGSKEGVGTKVNGRSWRSFLTLNHAVLRETERKGTREHKYWQVFVLHPGEKAKREQRNRAEADEQRGLKGWPLIFKTGKAEKRKKRW